MIKFFISHSTKDEIGPCFVDYLESVGIDRSAIFCSSNADTGIDATKVWFATLFEEIRSSDIVILLATPNYMRSGISLLEAGAALGAGKKLIILAFPNVDLSELKNMFFGHQLIDFSGSNALDIFKKCMDDNIIHEKSEYATVINEKLARVLQILELHTSANLDLPPIAMREEHQKIIRPCAEYGIERLTLEQIDMTERIKNARKIKILMTTGAGFFRKYNVNDYSNNPFYHALRNGCEIEILLGNPSGALFRDVEAMEQRSEGELNEEFCHVVREWNRLVRAVEAPCCGTVRMGNVDASLRQTVILIYDESVWGWATVTLPPARCNAQSLSLELKDIGNGGMIQKYENYFDAIWKKATTLGEVWQLNGEEKECFRYEGAFALKKWSELQDKAKTIMREAEESESNCLLIECAAQHPLTPNGTPGKEFQARLDRSVSLYREYTEKGWRVNIYVPGSLHQIKNKRGTYEQDKIALCDAGKNYLINKGIPEEHILGKDANDTYKGELGVYCSADECYVSSNLFLDGNYQRFIVVCSPAQAMRKALYYLLFSTLPIICTEMPQSHHVTAFHNYVYEAIVSIPEIIRTMDDMQGEDCQAAIQMRKDRNPYYQN